MATSFVIISNQKIPWSYIQSVRRRFGGDWDQTIDAFFKARNATGINGIIKYIEKGFLLINGKRYNFFPSKEHESGQMESIRQWWNTSIYTPKKGPEKLRASLKDALLDLANAL